MAEINTKRTSDEEMKRMKNYSDEEQFPTDELTAIRREWLSNGIRRVMKLTANAAAQS